MGEEERPHSTPPDLRARIALARTGDQEAVNDLCEYVRPLLAAFVERRLSPRARRWGSADDIVQGVLLEMVRQLPTLEPEAGIDEIMKRVFRTAGFRVQDAARNHGRLVGDSQLPDLVREGAREEHGMGSVTGRDYHGWLEQLVARLPEKYAQVVQLCAFEGLTSVEAARRLGLEPDTVRKRYDAARAALERRRRALER